MKRTLPPRALLAALVAASSACALDTTQPRVLSDADRVSADVAVSAGAGIAEDVGLLLLNETAMPAPAAARASAVAFAPAAPAGGWTGATACSFDAGSGRFQCPALTLNALTLTRSYALLDSAGAAQSSYDTTATASANFRMVVTGTVTRDDWTATVQRSRALTVSGLAGAEVRRTWSGTGASVIAGSGYTSGGVTRRYELEEADTLTDVLVALPRRDNPWPISGTATGHVTGTMTFDGVAAASRSVERAVTVTFNGTSIVPLDAAGVPFWLNLVTGKVVPRE